MFRAMSWTLHQRRYRALAIAMLLLAIGCAGAGTFELHRYHEKVQGNAALRANARTATVPLTPRVIGLSGAGAGSSVKYRSVRVQGRYDPGAQTYVANESEGGDQGFFVLTPLRTSDGVLLVGRGFVAETPDAQRPARIAAPPGGVVSIVGRLYPDDTGSDQYGQLGRGEITAINAGQQATRLGAAVYRSWLALDAGQPGTSGLRALPGPALSNPTGGAGEGQLLSYVVQWYVFALLALLAPFFFARAEARDSQRRYLGVDPDEVQFDAALAGGPDRPALAASASGAGALARRPDAGLARSRPLSARLARAEKLADRYGRSLGPDATQVADTAPAMVPSASAPRSSKDTPHRSDDAYHGSYNDYLWQLALADGEAPDVVLPAATSTDSDESAEADR